MFNKFKYRSDKTEMLDSFNIPKDLLFRNLRELDLLNRTLGGNKNTLLGVKKLLKDKDKTYHIVDLGCGSGDALRYIADWARKKGFKVKLTGVDNNVLAIEYMKDHSSGYPEINAVVSDYRNFFSLSDEIDIVVCSLFCHHLKDDALVELFKLFKLRAKGFVVNDLRRSWIAYYLVLFITHVFNGSRLAKKDGPVSVLRGFRKKELKELLHKAQVINFKIKRKWAFRYLIIGRS